jgi:hypothetical protein
MPGTDDDSILNFTLFDGAIGSCLLDVDLDHIANVGVRLVAAQNTDGPSNLGTGVVCDIQTGTNLDH